MTSKTRYSGYDPLARVYNEDWAPGVLQEVLPALEKLLLPHLSTGAHILDLGCGTGHLAQQLLIKGYQVTGLDGSEGMLRYAQENAGEGKFILGDARFFNFPHTFDAVVSIGAFNHVMELEELTEIFHNVYQALLDDGLFIFYMFFEEEYQSNWNGSLTGKVKEEYAWAAQNSYNSETKIAQFNLTIFSLVEETWQRLDAVIKEKCYSITEVKSALEKAGFTELGIYDAQRDFAINKSPGNTYFSARKRLNK
ncbi:class I SAM-dependent DNA methyltransferase [Cylindrospermum sp. FACHB-282]|uniref:class I SAM-dependent DNA methyltransferase n=1 Tax=Cylindrospermum sp. FACHB-282 TaxID=2692794 RepID=UPI001689BB2A|nr:class I SAM-dependent methyltransferase [Cylindrospermum sp. FACHB-282]MBD2385759.1 class I SAM-dependent methyltransferase [Cylindrospermum sp. FACHB-282]